MNIYLSNTVISDLQFNDYEIATYVALKSIYTSNRDTQFVSYNMITYELFNGKCTNTASTYIKDAFNSLVDKGLVTIVEKLSTTEFVLDLSKLYFEYSNGSNEYYTVIRLDEVHSIMNIANKMDKFKLLRYFITCLRTICRTQGIYVDQSTKQNFVGFMTQEYLCEQIGICYKSNFKLIQQYNDVLEEYQLLYIYRHTEMKRDKKTGQIKSFANHYGRYEDKDDIEIFALNYEKTCGVQEEIVQSDKSNQRRRLSSQYNNLCYDFDRYVDIYSDEELIEIYKYIHFKNGEIEKELETAKEGTEYYDRLLDKLKDEDLFDDIPCVVEYINKKCRETA